MAGSQPTRFELDENGDPYEVANQRLQSTIMDHNDPLDMRRTPINSDGPFIGERKARTGMLVTLGVVAALLVGGLTAGDEVGEKFDDMRTSISEALDEAAAPPAGETDVDERTDGAVDIGEVAPDAEQTDEAGDGAGQLGEGQIGNGSSIVIVTLGEHPMSVDGVPGCKITGITACLRTDTVMAVQRKGSTEWDVLAGKISPDDQDVIEKIELNMAGR